MDSAELKNRTQTFALEIIKVVDAFPKTKAGDVLGRQLLRSACSIAATTGLPAELNPMPTLFQKLVLPKRKPMNLYFGWNYH